MSWDNPSDIEMGYETRIGKRVYKTADPPQCTGCEHVNEDNECDWRTAECEECTRRIQKMGICDNYSLSGPDEPDERSEEV